MKRIATLITGAVIALIFASSAYAQFAIGASLERRSEEPKNGFGIRVEKGFKTPLPLLSLGLRAHLSAFSGDIGFTDVSDPQNINTEDIDLGSVDFGLMLIGGLKLPALPVTPYAGVGLGYELTNPDLPSSLDSVPNLEDQLDSDAIAINGLVGLRVSAIPIVKPFIEYRISGFTGSKEDVNAPGRLAFGIELRFGK